MDVLVKKSSLTFKIVLYAVYSLDRRNRTHKGVFI